MEGVLINAPENARPKARIEQNRTGRTRHEAKSRYENGVPSKTMHSPGRIDRIHASIELRGLRLKKCLRGTAATLEGFRPQEMQHQR